MSMHHCLNVTSRSTRSSSHWCEVARYLHQSIPLAEGHLLRTASPTEASNLTIFNLSEDTYTTKTRTTQIGRRTSTGNASLQPSPTSPTKTRRNSRKQSPYKKRVERPTKSSSPT